MVGQEAVVTQGDVLLLPLLVQGLPAPLQQDALEERERRTPWGEHVVPLGKLAGISPF